MQFINKFNPSKLRVGLLGGSFNPAHQGHLEISKLALKALELDYVIWLISPQNPFKTSYSTSIEKRVTEAQKIILPKIIISTLEYKLGYKYSYQIIRYLVSKFKNTKFIWLIGADNLINMHKWKNQELIFSLIDVAVFDRPYYAIKAYRSPTAIKYNLTISPSVNRLVFNKKIIFLRQKLFDISSTRLRSQNL